MTLILETSSGRTALETFRERYELEPRSKLFMPLAEELRTRGHYGEAIELCRRGKDVHPDYISCRVLLGRCLMELGMEEEARRELEEVLELDRENVVSLRVIAEMFRARGKLSEAADYYRATLRINPADADAQNRLAVLMRLQELTEDNDRGPSEQCVEPYEHAGFDEPENASAETIELDASALAAKWEAFSLDEAQSEEPAVSDDAKRKQLPEEPAVSDGAQCVKRPESRADTRAGVPAVQAEKNARPGAPVQFFDHEVRHSDFSMFTQWVSRVRQETLGRNESTGKKDRGAGGEASGEPGEEPSEEPREREHPDGQE